jgi:hypothetical protein
MKVDRGSFTVTTTGNKTVILSTETTMNVQKVVFTVTTNTSSEKSGGYGDLTLNFSGTQVGNETSQAYSVIHNRSVSGVTTRIIEGTLTNVSTAGQFTVNFSTVTQATQIGFVAYGS